MRSMIHTISSILRNLPWYLARPKLLSLPIRFDSFTFNHVLKTHPPMAKSYIFFTWETKGREREAEDEERVDDKEGGRAVVRVRGRGWGDGGFGAEGEGRAVEGGHAAEGPVAGPVAATGLADVVEVASGDAGAEEEAMARGAHVDVVGEEVEGGSGDGSGRENGGVEIGEEEIRALRQETVVEMEEVRGGEVVAEEFGGD